MEPIDTFKERKYFFIYNWVTSCDYITNTKGELITSNVFGTIASFILAITIVVAKYEFISKN